MFNVYACQPKMHYNGTAFIAAKDADEANQIIEDFKKSDPGNLSDSRGYSSVSESNLVKDLISKTAGIVYHGIFYSY